MEKPFAKPAYANLPAPNTAVVQPPARYAVEHLSTRSFVPFASRIRLVIFNDARVTESSRVVDEPLRRGVSPRSVINETVNIFDAEQSERVCIADRISVCICVLVTC